MKKSTARILTGNKIVTKHGLKALEFIELSLKSTDPASVQKCIAMAQELGAQATYTRLFKTFSYNDMHVLHYAACCANVVLTNNLVQFLGIDVNLRDNKGCTILHLAVKRNTPYYITYAVNVLHANINAVDKLGRMPIHYAILSQRPAAMQQLIDLGADTNSTIYYGKAVHIAASMGDVQALTALINKPDDVNYVIDSCINPLACAAYHGKLSSLTTLLEAGADVHISKLISKAIIVDSPETLSMVNLLLQHNSNPNEFDASMNEDPPIIAAAKRGQGDVVILLVDQTDPIDDVNWNATAITEYVRSAAFKEEDKVRVATRVAALRERMMKGLRETNILVARVCCIALKHDMSPDEWDKCQNLCELFVRLCHEGTRPQLDDLYSYAMKFRGQKSKVKELMALKAILLFEPEDVNVQRKLSEVLEELKGQGSSGRD